jgi:excisionase family DNA binding protein
MTPDELVTCNDLERMKESIIKAMEAMLHPAEPYLSFEQAVVYLKTTKRSLAERVRAREIPYIKDGKFIKFHRKDLDAYMESHRVMSVYELQRVA